MLTVTIPMHDDEVAVDQELVGRLLRSQLPGVVGDRRLVAVEPWGTDNAIWRLGDDLVVRLPRIGWAVDQVALEAEWLPRLTPWLPVAVPGPVAVGQPEFGYPFPWAVHRWLDGCPAGPDTISGPVAFARALAAVVAALRAIPIEGTPPARGRARPLRAYDGSARAAIESAGALIDRQAAIAVWQEALAAAPPVDPPVWVHGDLEGNCLVNGAGELAGLLDWGSACVGDPAVDVQVIWSPLFTPESRAVFLATLGVDRDEVLRSRGAAVHQACAALPYYLDTYPLIVERSLHKLAALGVPILAT